MELTNEFRVPVAPSTAWAVLTDLERIAPCMPGAELQEVEGDEFRGIVKVKVGPITAQYKGVARFVERDEGDGRAVLRAEGRETRGQGNANATITARLEPDGDGTRVTVTTDLTITGKVAQYGRGVLADVSAKLLDQFVERLEADVLSEEAPAPAPDDATSTNGKTSPDAPRKISSKPAEPVNLLGTAGAPVAKRAAPLVALLFLAAWLVRRRRKRRRSA